MHKGRGGDHSELGEMVVLVLAEVPEVMNVPQIMLD